MNNNGFFGSISGPFTANTEIFPMIEEQCISTVAYLSKIGIHYISDIDLDLNGIITPQIIVIINGIEFQIGKTGMLELQDINITSIIFKQDVNDKIYIDYQYIKE